jgi:hypothetical protein
MLRDVAGVLDIPRDLVCYQRNAARVLLHDIVKAVLLGVECGINRTPFAYFRARVVNGHGSSCPGKARQAGARTRPS